MADVIPDYQFEIQKLKRVVADFKMKIESHKCLYIESIHKQKLALGNIKATQKEVTKVEKDLDGLIGTHGDNSIDFDELLKGDK